MTLSNCERVLCCLIWIGGVLYSIYNVFLIRKEFTYLEDTYNDFAEGWLPQMPKKDVADFEWETVMKVFRTTAHYFIIHVVVSEYLRSYYIQLVPYWQSLISIIFLLQTVGLFGLLSILLQSVTFNYISLGKRKLVPWMTTGLWMTVVIYLKSAHCAEYLAKYFHFTEVQGYIVMLSLCWSNLRCLSYCLDDVQEKYKFVHFLSYCLYLPTLFIGPFIQFKDFNENFFGHQSTCLRERFWQLVVDLSRCIFWIFITEMSLHYFYINALAYQPEILQRMSNWALYGYGYCMGQFFHLKYVVFYGLSTSIAKFDHMKTPPLPKCIGRIHLYSDMWKYFDAGLYKFLVTYIYLPTLRTSQLYNKIFSSLLSFGFVYIWHGIEYNILIWTVINYIGICLENICNELVKLAPEVLNSSWRRRGLCILCSPLLAASAVSNFYFFAGSDVGNIFTHRIFQSSLMGNAALIFFLYGCCQLSLEVKHCEQNVYAKKKIS
uniref:Protein-cysteine N-palmitoyltransferase Rasp n=3 Tax=Photinus pyralis TaxID=7054 RepID=A0A1Y1LPQ2_PHOPY